MEKESIRCAIDGLGQIVGRFDRNGHRVFFLVDCHLRHRFESDRDQSARATESLLSRTIFTWFARRFGAALPDIVSAGAIGGCLVFAACFPDRCSHGIRYAVLDAQIRCITIAAFGVTAYGFIEGSKTVPDPVVLTGDVV